MPMEKALDYYGYNRTNNASIPNIIMHKNIKLPINSLFQSTTNLKLILLLGWEKKKKTK